MRCFAATLIALAAACGSSPARPDAAPADGAGDAHAMEVTLSETTSATIVQGNSIECQNNMAHVAETSYYRAFLPSDFGVSGAFHVEHVDFGVEQAKAGTGTQQATDVHVYRYDGAIGGTTLSTTSMTELASAPIEIPDGTGGSVSTALAADVPAGAALVAEIHIPDGQTLNNVFYIGSNASGETEPGYLRAPFCSTTVPTAIPTVAATTIDILVTVTGTYDP
jgi:hypothetical protein